MLLAFFTFTALLGCKQTELEVQNAGTTTQRVDIPTLTKYFANRINVDVNDIRYDEKTQQFSLRGVDQVNLEKLTRFYLNSITK
ncbi:MAG: hypothetical protein P0Y49_18655 [Candidatus Pedobacter colombiensis]|uniref:Uncharacterized protein n=1 Tax=Candidatus Pedobacter colombiensis TaxID=3121371 RepID=A0AAJ5W743_9SPHI|nr:hypothetical protein [Pedobacter sp.]WEK18800.1 MAG: hypothetical protein P0Y49_18655 [Pedobacter sp.]